MLAKIHPAGLLHRTAKYVPHCGFVGPEAFTKWLLGTDSIAESSGLWVRSVALIAVMSENSGWEP